jgi:hypothetical protein
MDRDFAEIPRTRRVFLHAQAGLLVPDNPGAAWPLGRHRLPGCAPRLWLGDRRSEHGVTLFEKRSFAAARGRIATFAAGSMKCRVLALSTASFCCHSRFLSTKLVALQRRCD